MLAGLDVLDPLMTKPSRPGEQPQVIPEQLSLSPAATGISNLRQQFSQPLLILMAVVSVVLLIACANVANLVLARSAARLPEFSMRLALGAGRWRLVRQLLVENVILATLGGLVGFLLARWATALLVTFMSSGRTPIVLSLEPDARILAFTALVSVLTGVLCGLVPALRASRVDVVSGLKGQARGSIGGSHWLRPGKILVVSQVALCLLLLFGAGLFVRSLQALEATGWRLRPGAGAHRPDRAEGQRPARRRRRIATTRPDLSRSAPARLVHSRRPRRQPGALRPTSRVIYSSPVGLPDGTNRALRR